MDYWIFAAYQLRLSARGELLKSGATMNTQSINDTSRKQPGRSMNSYLQHQSRKSMAVFEGSSHLGEAGHKDDSQQEWLRMEECLQRTRERIEKAVLAVKMASVNASQFDDDAAAPSSTARAGVSLVANQERY